MIASLTHRSFSVAPSPLSLLPASPDHAKVLHEISCFPLRVETISRKKAKAELEAKLQEIEGAITLFSRKRVLIQP
jgi:hypothetical protein